MLMHKSNPVMEAGEMPGNDLIARVGGMIGGMAEAGVFLDGAGLRQTALGVRLDFAGGRRTITPGPFVGGNELTAGLCTMRVRSLDEAVGWVSRFAEIVGDCQVDIRPITEPWDLGVAPKPADVETTRYMAVCKADRRFEAGAGITQATVDAVTRLVTEMKSAGVYQSAELFQPSATARRLRYSRGNATVTDGPFAESKELIAGFVMLNVASMAEALQWAPRYAEAVGDIELDIRPLREPAEFT
jgi:hypothetical protein